MLNVVPTRGDSYAGGSASRSTLSAFLRADSRPYSRDGCSRGRESPSSHSAGYLDASHTATWLKDFGESEHAVSRDERLAMALVKSHESLNAATEKFEESQKRNVTALSDLREWLDAFTGTAVPEDINPISAMLPEPGLENEVVGIMSDVQVHGDYG